MIETAPTPRGFRICQKLTKLVSYESFVTLNTCTNL
jgi:hypothetical protein